MLTLIGWLGLLIVGSIVVYCLIELKNWIDDQE